jgi:hypothetical protein
MPSDEEKWRKFDLLLANFQSIGKVQSRFVNSLIAFLCLVWAVDLLRSSGGITVQVLGATVQVNGLWQIVPLVCGILCLGLVGSINIIHHAWRRLDLHLPEVFSDLSFFFTEFDPHKNILDYLGNLTLSLKKPVLPDTTDSGVADRQQWSPILLLYPGLVLFSIFTTSFVLRRIPVNWGSVAYVFISTLLQAIFSLPFLWRKACIFTGVHKSAYEGVDWGDAAYYKMSMDGLRRLLETNRKRTQALEAEKKEPSA